jgi:DNA helicase-2/ATP-dependent DNA helicase PcrA
MQISYNKLKTFSECALKYRLAYIERLPRPALPALAFQRRLHAALARYHYFARRDGAVREEDLLSAYADIWGAEENPQIRDTKSYQEGEGILRHYCQTENRKQRIPAYIEHTIQFPFGPYTLTGKIDRIDFTEGKSYSIIDYKLDRRLPEENAADTSAQLSFYHLLVSEGLGASVEEVRLYYLRYGVEQVSQRSQAQMRETVEWIDQTASAIHWERAWEPCEGSGCPTCAFQSVCPAKTGRERVQQSVWRQGDLLWEMTDSSSADPAPEGDGPEPVAVGASTGVRQMSLEDYL